MTQHCNLQCLHSRACNDKGSAWAHTAACSPSWQSTEAEPGAVPRAAPRSAGVHQLCGTGEGLELAWGEVRIGG